jgi:hypothetical protein
MYTLENVTVVEPMDPKLDNNIIGVPDEYYNIIIATLSNHGSVHKYYVACTIPS